MLQWMGGSRRKVTASRRSTQKRQKQYFEQKKRQQQQTDGLDNNVDVVNGCGQHHGKSKSLDILSFMNLAKVAQETKSSLTNEESAEINPSPPKSHFLNASPARLVATVAPKYAAAQNKAETNSYGYDVEYVSPKKVVSSSPIRVASRSPTNIVSSCNHSANKRGNTLDNQKTETEHQFSVLDLLGDDGVNESSGGSLQEAHVAFAVEGLGKMEMGTPVHSPRQPQRASAPKPIKQKYSSRKLNYMNYLDLELNSMIHDVDTPPRGDPWESPNTLRGIKFNSGPFKSEQFTAERNVPLDAQVFSRDDFFSEEEYPDINIESRKLFEDGCRILDENFPDERTQDATWMNQACTMDSTYADFLRDEPDDESDFTFEDSYMTNKRHVAKAQRDFNILESPASYFKHKASVECRDFINLEAKRYPALKESWGFNLPTWSSFCADDGKDTISLLSEESSSSTAVKGGKPKYSARNSMLRKSPRKHVREFSYNDAKPYIKKDLYAEGMLHQNQDREHRVQNQKELGKHTRVPIPPRTKLFNHSEDTWLYEEEFTSVDIESGLASLECRYWSKDPFDVFPDSSLYLNTPSPCKKSKHSVRSSLFSGEALHPHPVTPSKYHDSPGFFHTDITQSSRMKSEPPQSYCATGPPGNVKSSSLSGHREVLEDESECGSSPKDVEKEMSVGNEFSSEIVKSVDVNGSKNVSEGVVAENGTPEPVTQDCTPEQAEATSVVRKLVLDEVESKCQVEGHMHFPHRICTEGNIEKEDSGNHGKSPSYQVMLESYVLQLLCVQKVLREASEQDSVKKV